MNRSWIFLTALCLPALVLGSTPFAPDSHVPMPGRDIAPFIVPAAKEPRLAEARLWRLLRAHVKYVFVIYQENRSFDSYFGTFPGADGLFSQPSASTPGFEQQLIDTNGS